MSWTSSDGQLPGLKLVPSILFVLSACILLAAGILLSWVIRAQAIRRRQIALEALRAAGLLEIDETATRSKLKDVPPIHESLLTAGGYIRGWEKYEWSDIQPMSLSTDRVALFVRMPSTVDSRTFAEDEIELGTSSVCIDDYCVL
ncbi:SubName: Full=Uncharacterized protein {ECO:0000313/EMBL:CCA73961.1} [Serendipita indica DSM 11827]|uniref:Uncharacterized protein n=1 Tax=Serendipita indica (strain DSM 11827) TaxID=1109443 RepID=G4TRM0_SERID|nr:SubName: Full=Uncharacterized protein {ECO:0000313/EMBL:CCA73961.1} [Serendipita indica DSM 11827]CCA73961.1 hypothetical protein PIIN_07915 [Serendipita indica DSM 11827]